MTVRKLTSLMLLVTATAWACQVPVFRYALERWEPGLYRVHAPGEVVIDALANAEVEKAAGATQLELFFPPRLRQAGGAPIWSAPMSDENVRVMLDSPVRQELKKRLLAGESAVWLLLESGDAAKDDAAAKTIEDGLLAAQKELKLPDGVITQDEADDPKKRHENVDVLQSDLPLRIAFSTMHLSRQNADESALIAMLMHLEPDLGEYVNEPMVFPIFGRGRAIEPLIGKGIHAANILEASAYLCGACSCEIKEQNPGIDLLMTADWDPVATKEVVETVKIVGEEQANSDDDTRKALVLAVAGGIVGTLINGWLMARWFARRKRRS
ncbi:MAG: hypothetical protein R3F13_00745 [Prosthecobacter sp.]